MNTQKQEGPDKPKNERQSRKTITIPGTVINPENADEVMKFLKMWQRKRGEPLISTSSFIKAAGVLAGYAVYKHVDPFPNNKLDNTVIKLSALLLLIMIVVPGDKAGKILLSEKIALEQMKSELTPEDRKQVIEYLSSLSAEQIKRALDFLKTDQGINLEMLKEEDMRKILLKYVGDDNEVKIRKEIEEIITEMKQFWADYWPGIKEGLKTADHAVAEKIMRFRQELENKGFLYSGLGERKLGCIRRFIRWIGS